MSNIAQIGLREPEQVDWANYNAGGSTFQAPPPALGPDGKPIVYYGSVDEATETSPDQGYLNYLLDPIKITKSGTHDGYTIRFTRASVRPFTKGKDEAGNPIPMKGNPNTLANFLRACQSQGKPQTNEQFRATVKACNKKIFPFTIDWEAYNKDTQEVIRGYKNFPDDPDRPGQKKAILKKGDTYTVSDRQGNVVEVKTVESDVLFANARLKYFQDPSRGQK
jgi:hypothetical protein